MYILKNAFISISRNKGRNILIGLIIIIIAIASTVSLAIKNSANIIIDSYESKSDITATIGMNRDKMMTNMRPGEMDENRDTFSKIEEITKEDIENFADSEYVKSYYYTYTLNMDANGLEKATSESNTGFTQRGMINRNGEAREINIGDFSIIGYNSFSAMSEFITGKYTIVDGEVSDDFNSSGCVINEELATVNDLKVGDKITLVNPNNTKLTYELTITGIYKENETSEDANMDMFTNSANTIVTNISNCEKMLKADDELMNQLNPVFVLKSKDDIEAFTTEVESKGLNEYRSITTNLSEIENETLGIKNLSSYVTTFLVITMLIGGVVLFVINLINIRERKYEIGVLRTIGMKKTLVGTQFVLELMSIAIFALFIGFGIGSSISVPVANNMLANEIDNQQKENEQVNENFGGPTFSVGGGRGNVIMGRSVESQINYISEINAAVDMKVLWELLAIGIILTLVSSSAAIINIAKFSPLSILKERS